MSGKTGPMPSAAPIDWTAKASMADDLIRTAEDKAQRLRIVEKCMRWAYEQAAPSSSPEAPIKAGDFVRVRNGGGRGRVIRVQCLIQSDQGGHVIEDVENVARLSSPFTSPAEGCPDWPGHAHDWEASGGCTRCPARRDGATPTKGSANGR